jgi:hypothetical protein
LKLNALAQERLLLFGQRNANAFWDWFQGRAAFISSAGLQKGPPAMEITFPRGERLEGAR